MDPRRYVLAAVMTSGCGRSHAFADGLGDDAMPSTPQVDEGHDEARRCPSGRQFADEVLVYDPDYADTPPVHPDVLDPEDALGPPDYDASGGYPGIGSVSLGQGGRLELAFRGCWLANDGSIEADLRIYEVGPAIEAASIYVRARPSSMRDLDPDRRTDRDGRWYFLGYIGGSVNELDVDAVAIDSSTVLFDAVRIEDDAEQGTGSSLAWGADIDAIELLSWSDPVD